MPRCCTPFAATGRQVTIEFRTDRKVARLHDPRRAFALTEIESEVRHDPLTGTTARICHLALRTPPPPDLAAIAAESAAQCPFCAGQVERVTPRFPDELVPGGRLRHADAVLIPNLFPYDDLSAVAVLCAEHFHPMDAMPERLAANGLALARDLTQRAVWSGTDPAYTLVTWNYMPPAGGTQVHPHMQVIVTTTPGNALKRQLEAEQAFLERTGEVFGAALLDAEAGGARWIGARGRTAWLVPYAPTGVLGDAMCVFRGRSTIAELDDADLVDFAAGLSAVLAGFAARGLWSFNLSLLPDAAGVARQRHWLTARLLPRLYLNPKLHVSDASYMQLLLGEPFSMVWPEEVAPDLRARFAGCP
jgi:UDPglucose--hexose-1-phosphate uridylyltransferase